MYNLLDDPLVRLRIGYYLATGGGLGRPTIPERTPTPQPDRYRMLAGLPELPKVEPLQTASPPDTLLGIDRLTLATLLGRMGTALAPDRVDRWGRRVPTVAERLGSTAADLASAQLIARALAARPAMSGPMANILPFLLRGGVL